MFNRNKFKEFILTYRTESDIRNIEVLNKYLDALSQFDMGVLEYLVGNKNSRAPYVYLKRNFKCESKPSKAPYNYWFLVQYGYHRCFKCHNIYKLESFTNNKTLWHGKSQQCKLCHSDYLKDNKQLYNTHKANRRALELSRSIIGYEKEIILIYLNCPEGYHVDHIVPLQGSNGECGIHAPWNLQYLTAEDNLKKSNNYTEEIPWEEYLEILKEAYINF